MIHLGVHHIYISVLNHPTVLLSFPSLPSPSPFPASSLPAQCSSAEEFEELLSGLIHSRGDEGEGGVAHLPQVRGLRFIFTGLNGVETELCSRGQEKTVT